MAHLDFRLAQCCAEAIERLTELFVDTRRETFTIQMEAANGVRTSKKVDKELALISSPMSLMNVVYEFMESILRTRLDFLFFFF